MQPLHSGRLRMSTSPLKENQHVDAIQLLKNDHKEMKALLEELAATTARAVKTRTELVGKIKTNLTAHATIEEQIFYPAYRDAGGKEQEKMYFEALEEHRAAKDLVLADLVKTDPSTEQFSGRAKVLKELIEHHIEEEEQDMFKQAKQLIEPAQLKSLGSAMHQLKDELLLKLKKAA